MTVSRMDLADCGSPDKLVIEILRAEPDLPIPIPIEKLARQLGITEVKTLETEGFIGGLITDQSKSRGIILLQKNLPNGRRRFTLAHELAHFLIPTHKPGKNDSFLCSLSDLMAMDKTVAERRLRWEAEANRFAGLILVPAPYFRRDANAGKDPDIGHIIKLADRYEVSKEVAGRAYVDYREEAVALLITKDGRLLRSYSRRTDFPYINVKWGDPVPRQSLLVRGNHELATASEIEEVDAGVWLEVRWGSTAPTIYEQVYRQQQGFALILLTMERPEDEDDEDDDRKWSRRNA